MRVARRALACALPRPSAIASAKFAKSTVSQSQTAITPTNQRPAVRHLPLATVNKLIDDNTDGRSFGFFGEPGVNVLKLNVALDKLGGA